MTTGLHERVEYAISVCGKGFILYRKTVFLEYQFLYSTHKIKKRVPLPRKDFRNLQNFQNGRPYIAQNSKISKNFNLSKNSKMSKDSKISKMSKNSKIPRPNAQDFGKQRGELLGNFGNCGTCGNFELGKHNGALFGNFGILCYKGGLFGNFGNLQRVLGTSATDHCLVSNSRTELVQA